MSQEEEMKKMIRMGKRLSDKLAMIPLEERRKLDQGFKAYWNTLDWSIATAWSLLDKNGASNFDAISAVRTVGYLTINLSKEYKISLIDCI